MKPTTTMKRTFMPPLNLGRIGALAAASSVTFAMAMAGCTGGWDYSGVPEGDRCNPYDSHNECASGLQCTVSAWQVANQAGTSNLGTPELALQQGAGTDSAGNYNVLAFCPENYCCPVDSNGDLTGSGNANCQPGCNGGAQAICAANGDNAPYNGVCEFADSGVLPSPDAGGGGAAEASTPETSTPETSTPETSTPETSTPETSTPAEASTDGSSGG